MAPRKSSKEPKSEQLGLDTSLPPEEGRQKALEATLTDLTKRFGDGTVMRLGDAQHMVVEVIPSGSLTVDIAVGVGGIPRGRVTEIYGPESSGKTTICLHVIAEAQKRGGLAAFVDMEHALDPSYAARIGVNINSLYVAQPDTAEQALEITEAFVRSGAMDVVVLDSVAALVPRVEIEGEMGDSHVGLQARLMSQALRKLAGAIKSSNATVIFTNQLREKIGVMYGCFSYNAPVQLADGTTRTIGEIVNQKQPVEVLTYNHDTMQFEPKQVVNWFKQGVSVDDFTLTDNQIGAMEDEFLTITAERFDGSIVELTCTPNHEIATPTGYQMADDLEPDDDILVWVAPELRGEWAAANTQKGVATATLMEAVVISEATLCRIVDVRYTMLAGEDAVRYNLQVADNANYLVGGVVVHNSPETTSGGRALKFYASIRMESRKLESLKNGAGEVMGNRTRVRVTKNKVAPPFREAEFDIMFMEGGISKSGEILDLATELGIIEKRGAFFRYNDGLLGQGRDNAKTFLAENMAIRDELEDAVRAHYGMPQLTR